LIPTAHPRTIDPDMTTLTAPINEYLKPFAIRDVIVDPLITLAPK
jgi:hypothetical protein